MYNVYAQIAHTHVRIVTVHTQRKRHERVRAYTCTHFHAHDCTEKWQICKDVSNFAMFVCLDIELGLLERREKKNSQPERKKMQYQTRKIKEPKK